jgi:hypothetical protein
MPKEGISKRAFLQSVSAGVPSMLAFSQTPPAQEGGMRDGAVTRKATPIDCSNRYTASSTDLGPRAQAAALATDSRQDKLIRLPGGDRALRGIPFRLGPEDVRRKSWIAVSRGGGAWTTAQVDISVDRAAAFVCMAAFCDWKTTAADDADLSWARGQHLADLTLTFTDGSEQRYPVRRGFEVNPPWVGFGELCYRAVPHREAAGRSLTDALSNASLWGLLQTGVRAAEQADPGEPHRGMLWVTAFESAAGRTIRNLRFDARAVDPLMIAGLTLYEGRAHPLRYEAVRTYRFGLSDAAQSIAEREWQVDVDLGEVAKVYQLPAFDENSWLSSQAGGARERVEPRSGDGYLYADIAAAPDAVITVRNRRTAAVFAFDLGAAAEPKSEGEFRAARPRVEVIAPHTTWVQARVLDASTASPTPVCVSFRTTNDRYIPPYGHRSEINTGWFQDYGADVERGGAPAAYVDGTFQIELPVGDVLVEITKGFEYEPLRRKLRIEPGQRELRLEISRFADLRSAKWASADTHVHFLSPSTAVLEGQAEGLNLIHLLAAQWGELYTNVGDLSHGPLRSRDGEMIVHVGTENRQHLLGHLSLLGAHGSPVFPMSADGPGEGHIGMPLWSTLAEWADRSRASGGLAVAVHFPLPIGELAADIALGKIDAVELMPRLLSEEFDSLPFRDWYRYLNCGYRLPVVGGTDKMRAGTPVGLNRTFAYLDDGEFNVENWSNAVRRGNTFMSSGPLLFFKADGRSPGQEIAFRAGGGRVEVEAQGRSTIPIHRLDIVWNGRVVASRAEARGTRELQLKENVALEGPGWLAARCFSRFEAGPSRVAAHTSPVYVTVPGKELFSAPIASYMLRLIDGAEIWAREIATRPDPETFERALRVFKDARAAVEARLRRHAG